MLVELTPSLLLTITIFTITCTVIITITTFTITAMNTFTIITIDTVTITSINTFTNILLLLFLGIISVKLNHIHANCMEFTLILV